jgi:hypothetical protein
MSARYRAHPGTARLEGVLRDAAPLSGYLCVFSEGNATDSEHARQLAQLFQLRLRPVAGASDHNVIYEAHKKRAAIALFKEVGLV